MSCSVIDVGSGPLLRCTYLYDDGSAEGDFVFACDHSMVDAASAWQLYGEFLDLCAGRPSAVWIPVSECPVRISLER